MDSRKIIQATGRIYLECARDAAIMLVKNWFILIASIAAWIIFQISISLFARLGYAGGFIVGIVNVLLLTFYYRWISECVRKNPLKLADYLEFDKNLFSSVINAAFFLYIFMLLTSGITSPWPIACINLALFILLNALPEVIYMRGAQGLNVFSDSYSFIRDNWIEWFLPFLIFFSPVVIAAPVAFLFALTSADPLLPVNKFIMLAMHAMSLLLVKNFILAISLILATWFMIFRGFLFRELEFGSRRHRAFKMAAER